MDIKAPAIGNEPETVALSVTTSAAATKSKPMVLPEVTEVAARAKSPFKVMALVVPASTVNKPEELLKTVILSLKEL